jgi:hypothetical protein
VTFSGKELFEHGIPQNKIKFFINREFDSVDSLLDEINQKSDIHTNTKPLFTWVDWLWETFTHLPCRLNGDKPEKMSRSELKRILDSKSLNINDKCFTSKCECTDEEFPIFKMIWFPNSSKRKNTWV